MGGKSTLRTRLKALDRVFGEYIRRKYADSSGNVRCVTCGRVHHWKAMNAGHFWKRGWSATRWDERNVHPQDPHCNLYRGGAEAEHAGYIYREYGQEVFEELERKHLQIFKPTREWVDEQIDLYKQKLKDLDLQEVIP